PLAAPISKTLNDNDLVAASVLSGNRNFEGRVSPDVRANYLASPPLVVAYSLFGTTARDITSEAIGTSNDGKPVYLKDIWPTTAEVASTVASCIDSGMFKSRYANVFTGDAHWQKIDVEGSDTYTWRA